MPHSPSCAEGRQRVVLSPESVIAHQSVGFKKPAIVFLYARCESPQRIREKRVAADPRPDAERTIACVVWRSQQSHGFVLAALFFAAEGGEYFST